MSPIWGTSMTQHMTQINLLCSQFLTCNVFRCLWCHVENEHGSINMHCSYTPNMQTHLFVFAVAVEVLSFFIPILYQSLKFCHHEHLSSEQHAFSWRLIKNFIQLLVSMPPTAEFLLFAARVIFQQEQQSFYFSPQSKRQVESFLCRKVYLEGCCHCWCVAEETQTDIWGLMCYRTVPPLMVV